MGDEDECHNWDLERKPTSFILYLGRYNGPKMIEKWDIPYDLTQPMIAEALGMARSNICRYMSDLIESGFVEKELKHIINHGRKRNAYFLTHKGMRAYKVLKARTEKETPQ